MEKIRLEAKSFHMQLGIGFHQQSFSLDSILLESTCSSIVILSKLSMTMLTLGHDAYNLRDVGVAQACTESVAHTIAHSALQYTIAI